MSDTKPDLDAIEARANAATEGPWFNYGTYPFEVEVEDADLQILVAGRDGNLKDSRFAAHAREDVPTLVAYARTLEAQRGQWKRAANAHEMHAKAAEAERDQLAHRLDQVRTAIEQSQMFPSHRNDLLRVLDGDQRTETP